MRYDGDARIDGVPGSAAPIVCNYLDVAGSASGSLLPTGRALDVVDGVEITCIDNGMPVVVLRAKDLGITGYETPKELDANKELKASSSRSGWQVGPKMNLGDVTKKVVPKMSLSRPRAQAATFARALSSRTTATRRSACSAPCRWRPRASCRAR